MKIRSIADQIYIAYLGNNLGASFTQDWALRNQAGERTAFFALGHAAFAGVFNVQIASDALGTGAASIGADITTLATGKVAVIEYDAAQLTDTKQYSSALLTRSAGNVSLLELRYDLRQEGRVTQHSSVLSITEILT